MTKLGWEELKYINNIINNNIIINIFIYLFIFISAHMGTICCDRELYIVTGDWICWDSY